MRMSKPTGSDVLLWAVLVSVIVLSRVAYTTSEEKVAQIEARAPDYFRSVGLNMVDIDHVFSDSEGVACYRVKHPLEELPYLACLTIVDGQTKSEFTQIGKVESPHEQKAQ